MITPGTLLIEKDTLLPACFSVDDEPSGTAWRKAKKSLTVHEQEKQLAATGWIFHYMAGRITANAFGFDREKSVRSAIERLIATVKLQKCNCLEIDAVAQRSFCGLPYVSVSAHARRLQKGMTVPGAPAAVAVAPIEKAAA